MIDVIDVIDGIDVIDVIDVIDGIETGAVPSSGQNLVGGPGR